MKATQGRRIIAVLKRRPMTYMQMLGLGVSVCPWKRIAESLAADEKLIKATNARGLVVWRVVGKAAA